METFIHICRSKVQSLGDGNNFYCDKLQPDYKPSRYLQVSKNRVVHVKEVVDNSDFDSITDCIAYSYDLTLKK